jgi:O-acetyl-ADP-ribose deacetylase (regulator of RNase III)
MGKGIALTFKRAYPANFRAYRVACGRGELRLGRVWAFQEGGRHILNFPTRGHWREACRLPDIAAGLESLVTVVGELSLASVAVPAVGCGLGGLAWADVRPLIETAGARLPGVRLVVYPPGEPVLRFPPAVLSMGNAGIRSRHE